MRVLFISLPPPQHRDEYRRRGSYLQFGASIKMLIVGNHFSAVTMEALSLRHPTTARRMDPPESTTQNSPNTQKDSTREMIEEFLPLEGFFCGTVVMFLYTAMALTVVSQPQMLD